LLHFTETVACLNGYRVSNCYLSTVKRYRYCPIQDMSSIELDFSYISKNFWLTQHTAQTLNIASRRSIILC